MKVFIRIYWVIRNVGDFLRGLSRYERFYWDVNGCRSTNCKIDKTAIVYGNHMLTNVNVGYSSYISFNAFMMNTTIGKFCSVGPNSVSGVGIHPIHGISTHPAFYSRKKKSAFTLSEVNLVEEHSPITIGNDVFIGANVTILDGITIGDGAVIGAGAVVSKDIPPYAVAIGCPIQIVKYRFSPEVIDSLLKSQWWDHEDLFQSVKKNIFQVNEFVDESTLQQVLLKESTNL